MARDPMVVRAALLAQLATAAALHVPPSALTRAPHLSLVRTLASPSMSEDLSKLTVKVLKEKLREQGLPVSGLKAELIARLSGGIDGAANAPPPAAAMPPPAMPPPKPPPAKGSPMSVTTEASRLSSPPHARRRLLRRDRGVRSPPSRRAPRRWPTL